MFSCLFKGAKREEGVDTSKRLFLRNLTVGSLIVVGGLDTASAKGHHKRIVHHATVPAPPPKILSLANVHTGERLKCEYFEKGSYINEALDEINHLFRDYHDDTVHAIDPALLDQLYELKHVLDVKKPFNILSGYRSPETNLKLSKNDPWVSKESLHMQGRALDIHINGVDTALIRDAALAIKNRGGVGYYEKSDFVHLDTGRVREWEHLDLAKKIHAPTGV